ncbi:hypothetical protein Tco_0557335 [Tanacetum coccineum]
MKINISSINYSELNKLSEEFGKRFVPQMQLSVEQAFWLQLLNPKFEQLNVTQTQVEIEVPKELPKVSLVNTSFQKLKNYLASFDKVEKVRTTPDAITEGSSGFEHTKKFFLEEVITFINSLRASFKDFENGLHIELTEVKTVFNQMEAAFEQCFRLEQENDHLFELLLSQDIVNIYVNYLATLTKYTKMEQDHIDEYSENLVLKVAHAKKEHMVEKKFFDEVVLGCSRLENHSANLELKLQHQKESFLNNKPLNNQNAPEIQEFFHINEWQAKLEAKDVSIAKLKKHIENLKGKNVVEKDASPNNACVIAPGMFKLDLEPLSHILKNNREAHEDYLQQTKEHTDTLRGLVERARKQNPSDPHLDYAYANSKFVCSTCNGCLFSANHDKCVVTYINDVNKRAKSKYGESKKMEWKPTGKVFTSVGHRWSPTGRTFTINGTNCPLTRITSNTIVPQKVLETQKVSVTSKL